MSMMSTPSVKVKLGTVHYPDKPIVNLKLGTIQLTHKPTASLRYSFAAGDGDDNKTLVVFLNGLILPQSSWAETISQIAIKTQEANNLRPHLLSYDRYGQGLSDRDPNGTHDVEDVVTDLYAFLQAFTEKELNSRSPKHLILVGNSIGCAFARLYAAAHPGTVSGFIFLDSIMAHIDLASLWPDPDDPKFDEKELPKGTTTDQLRHIREKYRTIFDVYSSNAEGLDRSGLPELLPLAYTPKLQGPDGPPWITVIGHDPDTFAAENERSYGVPQALVNKYINPIWHEYNEGLTRLTEDEERRAGPAMAGRCGHFIQRDDPVLTAERVLVMLHKTNSTWYAR
ncbi:alpha/beta-hydrolase [Aureobasidium pullulans]|uniref:Alpha/beta-hydrolase n=1 Tax=Aureobasidium pullulans TaxID=5580 RepID=A0A4S8ZQ57_AURPU|nr:alpha/beta-hydrolase [Aureobasidium pullulans]THX80728.1 alpha/beta-hydrolase [Aureobasidium pullulans]THY14595.1 alpha/beta-hydrolase [Aureobasidium pullulans]